MAFVLTQFDGIGNLPDLMGGIPPLTGVELVEWSRSVVSEDYCKRLACGAITQDEAGRERNYACGIAYPLRPMGWCSEFCSPYIDEIRARYGRGLCRPVELPPPPPVDIVPEIIPDDPEPELEPELPPLITYEEVPARELPRALRPKEPIVIDCPPCDNCLFTLGSCCITWSHVFAAAVIAGIVVAGSGGRN